MFDDIIVKAAGLRGEGTECGEGIAMVDAGVMRQGADAMCGVQVAIAMNGMFGAPAGFGKSLFTEFAAGAAVVLSVVEFYSPEVMLVTALEVDDLAKQSLLDHVEYGQYIAPVADVLQHHNVGVMVFCGFDDIPVVLQGDAEDDFGGHVFEAGLE